MTHPTSLAGTKTFSNPWRSSSTVSHFPPARVSTPPATARARSSPLNICRSETAPSRSSSNLAAATSYRPTACNTPQPQKKTSYKTAPCDEHTTSNKNINLIKTHFRRTQPPLLAPRLSLTPHAAVLLSPMCHPLVSAHQPQQPESEAHL